VRDQLAKALHAAQPITGRRSWPRSPDGTVELDAVRVSQRGVLLFRPPAATLGGLPLDLEADLERLLHVRTQVVVLDRAPADLVHRVLRDGTLLVDRDRARRIAFEVRARNEFFDLKPILDQHRRARTGP
jgi:hypothetical protein